MHSAVACVALCELMIHDLIIVRFLKASCPYSAKAVLSCTILFFLHLVFSLCLVLCPFSVNLGGKPKQHLIFCRLFGPTRT